MKKIYKSRCIALEMLTDRGFEIPEKEHMDYDQFIEVYGEDETDVRKNMTISFSKPTGIQILVFWNYQIGIGDVQNINNEMESRKIKHAIVIYHNKITSQAAATMKQLRVQNMVIEIFHESSLQYNVTKSLKVPKHIICSKQKKEDILNAYNVTKEQIPQIKADDPVVKYYGAVRGQLIKIIRPSESVRFVGEDSDRKELYDISYRIVC